MSLSHFSNLHYVNIVCLDVLSFCARFSQCSSWAQYAALQHPLPHDLLRLTDGVLLMHPMNPYEVHIHPSMLKVRLHKETSKRLSIWKQQASLLLNGQPPEFKPENQELSKSQICFKLFCFFMCLCVCHSSETADVLHSHAYDLHACDFLGRGRAPCPPLPCNVNMFESYDKQMLPVTPVRAEVRDLLLKGII